MDMNVINEKQMGMLRLKESDLVRLTYYDLALIFRTEFRSKSKAA